MLTTFPHCNLSLEFPELLSQNLICYHWPSVFGNSKIMHCGILINMPLPIEIRCKYGSRVLALGKFWPNGDIVIPFFLDEIMGSNPRCGYPTAETIFRKLINISDPLWCSLKQSTLCMLKEMSFSEFNGKRIKNMNRTQNPSLIKRFDRPQVHRREKRQLPVQ